MSAVSQRVSRFHLLLLWRELGMVHFGHSGYSLESCAYGGAGFASFSPHVNRTGVTEVCLSLDTPFGRRSVGAFSG